MPPFPLPPCSHRGSDDPAYDRGPDRRAYDGAPDGQPNFVTYGQPNLVTYVHSILHFDRARFMQLRRHQR